MLRILFGLIKDDILKMRNMGKRTFDEINEKVKALGLKGW